MQTKYTLFVKCKLAKLSSDPWDSLEDLGNIYKGTLNKPYVSTVRAVKLGLSFFSPSKFINIYILLTISIQNKLFCCENIIIDHTLQAIRYEKLNSPKLFKRKVWTPFRRI